MTITRRTCAAITGLDERPWSGIVVKHIPHTRIGRELIVLTSDWLNFIASQAARAEGGAPTIDATAEEPETADSVLAELGLRRAS